MIHPEDQERWERIDRNLRAALFNAQLACFLVSLCIVLVVLRGCGEHRELDSPRPAPAERAAP